MAGIAWDRFQPDSCSCDATKKKVRNILSALQRKSPNQFRKLPTDIQFRSYGEYATGATPFYDSSNMRLNSDLFCNKPYSIEDLVYAVAHEALHANDPWYQRLIDGTNDGNDPNTHHGQLDDAAYKAAQSIGKNF